MPTTHEPATDDRRGSSRKALTLAAAAVVILGGMAFFLSWYHPIWRMWIHGATKKEYRDKLVGEQEPEIVPLIDQGMRDADLSDATRLTLAQILLDKNRLAYVEKALKDPRLDVRLVALRVLWRQGFFIKSYLSNDEYGVNQIILAWLRDRTSRTRGEAASITYKLYPNSGPKSAPPPPEVLEAVRALIGPPPGEADEGDARAAAAATLVGWNDCASAPTLLSRAASEHDFYARFHILQSITQMYDASPCRDSVPEAQLLAAVDGALAWPGEDGNNRAVRMTALSILRQHPDWAKPRIEAIRARLRSLEAAEPERRYALDALVASKDATTLDTFPRWFHDESEGLRAFAAEAVQAPKGPLSPEESDSCLVGFLRTEPFSSGHNRVLEGAYAAIHAHAGRWVGLPTKLVETTSGTAEMFGVLKTLFEKGEAVGVTRDSGSDALWRWLAERNGLAGADVDKASASRDAFWERAKSGDVAAAKAILDPLLVTTPKLWTYERGWLLAHAGK
jgi:hypothetical protein